MAILLFLVVFLVIVYLVKWSIRPPNFPPGPKGLPLIGNLLMLTSDKPAAYFKYQKLSQTYGSVVGFYVGPNQPVIVVTGYKAVKDVLLNDDLIGRPSSSMARSRSFGQNLGYLFNDGQHLYEQKRFTLRHLRDLGFGKNSMEDQMMEEVQELIKETSKLAQAEPNQIVNLSSEFFSLSVINVLWTLIGGERFCLDDVAFRNILHIVDLFLKSCNQLTVLIPIPELLVRHFPSITTILGANTLLLDPVKIFIHNMIDQHLAARSKGDAPRDFIDVYLQEMEKRSENLISSFSYEQLVIVIEDLLMAGADTSSNAIAFAMLFMVRYDNVQRLMQAELDQVCGDCFPSLAHRSRLPYTEAVLMEILRVGSIAPTTIPHVALRDTIIQGFHIPIGSIVAVSLDSSLKDESMWKDPHEFNPDRHLNEEGKIVKNEAFVPFGLGKRACLGEPLARNTFYLFVAALIKTFEFKPVPNEPLPTLNPITGITNSPRPYRAVIVPRHSK